MRKIRGFTLIELMITVTIVGLLASIALPLYEVTVQRGKEKVLRQALRDVRGAIDAYKRASDEGRIAKEVDRSGYPPTLAVLVEGVPDIKDPKGSKIFFLRRVPTDPVSGEALGLRSYESPHDEPKPGKDVYDVYSVSSAVGLNGIQYREW
jgi:general secretion pathway protein G